jgi:GTPase SAR1 family protein
MSILRDNSNKVIEYLNENIETVEMLLNDSTNDASVVERNVKEKSLEQYKLLKTIMELRLRLTFFQQVMTLNEKETIISTLNDLKKQFSEITVDVLEVIEKGVQNNEISENDYIKFSNDIMKYNKLLPVICGL